MALHPVNDRFKVKITKDDYGFGSSEKTSAESGIVVEVPDMLIYLSFHSFAFEVSLGDTETMKRIQEYYNQFLGKRIYWEALQDRGRMITEREDENDENGTEYVYLQMTDLLAYADDVDEDAKLVDQVGKAGSFNLS